jgi:hypothetical protein
VRNDGSNSWSVDPDYAGQGYVTGNAAILRRHDLCWVHDGYGDPQPVDARTLDRATLVSLRYEADTEALVIIDEVLAATS